MVLVGMMLSGKSTAGLLAAQTLGIRFVDADSALVARTGRTVSDWFLDGESAFRRVEKETMLALVTDPKGGIIAAGGGAFEDQDTRTLCLEQSLVVYLSAEIDTLVSRYAADGARPLLAESTSTGVLRGRLLSEREQSYLQAHETIVTDRASPAQVAAQLGAIYTRYAAD